MSINGCSINTHTINSICARMIPYIQILLDTEPTGRAGAQHNGFVFSAYNAIETNFAQVERDPNDDKTLVVYDAHNINFELHINGEVVNVTFDKADPNFKPFVQVKNLAVTRFEDRVTIEISDINVN